MGLNTIKPFYMAVRVNLLNCAGSPHFYTTLESRRTMTRLTLLYKMSRGEIDIDTDSFLRPHAESRTRASHSYRYRQDIATKNLYFYSFFPRTLRQWTNLPADIVESNSLSQFQSKLSDHLSHV